MKSKIYTDFSINNILHLRTETEAISTIETNTSNEILNHTRKASFPIRKRKRDCTENNPPEASQRHNKRKSTNYNFQLFENSSIFGYPTYLSGFHWEPIFFELSSLCKLQKFVDHHKIEENRYLSSPNLMTFEESNFHDMIGDGFNASAKQKNYGEEEARYLPDDEMIDIESVPNCYVTSSSDKASERISSNSSATLYDVRNELSKLEPPKWTKQQQPKRVYKSEENHNPTSITMVRYTKNQVDILNQHFYTNENPSSNEFHRIAKVANLNHYQVKKWFQNRRAKKRKSVKH